MGTTRFTAEVDSETLARAREVLNREQITLDETLQEMLSHIVSHDTAPCFRCGDPNPETPQAMAEAEDGEMLTADTVAALFTDLNVVNDLRPKSATRLPHSVCLRVSGWWIYLRNGEPILP